MANQSQKTRQIEAIAEEKEKAYISLLKNPLDNEAQERALSSKTEGSETTEAFKKIGIKRENAGVLIADLNAVSKKISYIAEFCKNASEKEMFALKKVFGLLYSKNEKEKNSVGREILEISKKNKMLGSSLQSMAKNTEIADFLAKKHMEYLGLKKENMHDLFSLYYDASKDQKLKELMENMKTREKFKRLAILFGKADLIQIKAIIEKFLNHAIAGGASEESINAFASLLIKELGSSPLANNFKFSRMLFKASEFFRQFRGDKIIANLVSEAYGSRKNI